MGRMNNKYSIILPVRNGGEYIKECIESILSQTYHHFNLIILDSGSTDNTLLYIQSLNDSRIELYTSSKPLTIEENWHRIINIQKNEFITLIGHDDILDKNYLSVMDTLIQKHPHATLYQAHFRYINSEGNSIKRCMPMDEVQTASEFLASVLANTIDIMGTGFMMRAKDYDEAGGIPLYPNLLFADFELWINLTMRGYKATAFQECFAFRRHLSTTTTSSDTKLQQAFFLFISYLIKLKENNCSFQQVTSRYGINFILHYCKGLAHRLLRTPLNKRNGETVSSFLLTCKQKADELVPNNNFYPKKQFNIWLAEVIDNNFFTRNLFLLFKKIYSKPIYN
jgi:glycosyltransferase involved in cell wall biosynthesis